MVVPPISSAPVIVLPPPTNRAPVMESAPVIVLAPEMLSEDPEMEPAVLKLPAPVTVEPLKRSEPVPPVMVVPFAPAE